MLNIIHSYDPETETFRRIIQLDLRSIYHEQFHEFTEEWKNNDEEETPYSSIQVGSSLEEQLHQEFPDVPMDEWESWVDSLDEANDSIEMEETWDAFIAIYDEYVYDA